VRSRSRRSRATAWRPPGPPARCWRARTIIKDLSYALALAESAGVKLEQAATTKRLMERTMEAGYRDNYYTAVIRTIAPR